MELKICDKNDLKNVAQLADVIWKKYYIDIITMEQIEYMLHKFYAMDALIEQVENGQIFYQIYDSNFCVGFVSISPKSNDSYFINKFYILQEHQKLNLGTYAMNLIIDQIKSQNKDKITKIRLTVNRKNFKAINFYFKNGFKIESVEDFDIGNNYEMNDFVMLKII